jgi:hypothetical protein
MNCGVHGCSYAGVVPVPAPLLASDAAGQPEPLASRDIGAERAGLRPVHLGLHWRPRVLVSHRNLQVNCDDLDRGLDHGRDN